MKRVIRADEEIQVHPAATLFPMMGPEEMEGLKQDIQKHGLATPIVLWQGQLVDGRNRLQVCRELEIDAECRELDPQEDPYRYVVSHNLHRRHLTVAQRSMVAAKMATLKRGEVGNGRPKVEVQICTSTSMDEAADMLNVSRRSVATAKKVIESAAPALVDAVEQGKVAVSLAAKLVDECDDKRQQTRLAKQGKQAIKDFITPTDERKPPKAESPNAPAPNGKVDRLAAIRAIYQDVIDALNRGIAEMRKHEPNDRYFGVYAKPSIQALSAARTAMKNDAPAQYCPDCQGKRNGCGSCQHTGLISTTRLKSAKAAASVAAPRDLGEDPIDF